ncbi:MAG: MBL fold metallo-hydrolase [Ruminococcaceae bacterium]|nr:MBL fold metallo-hydrolase [Oscillospiraceae bacterium]
MDSVFEKATDGIYRLDIPFDHLYTSVFLITGDTPVIVDSATTREDVSLRILPALSLAGFEKGSLLVTHRHGDHNGGTPFLLSALPALSAVTLRDGETLGTVRAIRLGGHTEDSMGYFDTRTGTLLCGDALQFYGVGKYGCSIVNAAMYEETLDRIKTLAPEAILPSHDFVGGSAAAIGKNSAAALFASAREKWEEIKAFILSFPQSSAPFDVVRAWKTAHPTLPPLPSITVKSVWKNA